MARGAGASTGFVELLGVELKGGKRMGMELMEQ